MTPTSLSLLNEILAAGILFFSVVLMGKTRLPGLLRHYALASFCLAGVTFFSALQRHDTHGYWAALITLAFKAIVIPRVLHAVAIRSKASYQLRFYLKPANTYFVVCLVLPLIYLITRRLPVSEASLAASQNFLFPHAPLFISVALVLLGILFMIVRRDLYSQIVGFLTMENGVAAFGALAVGGIPLLIEMGIVMTVVAGVIVMAILSRQVQAQYSTGDTARLTELTE